jgi:hypothetical protein
MVCCLCNCGELCTDLSPNADKALLYIEDSFNYFVFLYVCIFLHL